LATHGSERPDDPPARLELRTDNVVASVAPREGGRLASLVVDGHELLVTSSDSPYGWGAFPMVPYAGRIRHGDLRFRGRTYHLPITMPPHAIHGTLTGAAWQAAGTPARDDLVLTARLTQPWPFRGRVLQRFRLESSALHICMELDAEEPMPGWMGWHPWFRRRVDGAGPLELSVDPEWMLVRDREGIPTGERVRPTARPWDDVFTDLPHAPRLRWPGLLRLSVESACRYWVIYDEQPHGLCVEPQTGPPDAGNWLPEEEVLVEPGRPLTAAMTLRWEPDAQGGAPTEA
jgi:aldose 1-epimerase